MSKQHRLDLYLQQNLNSSYTNTEQEQLLLNKFSNLYDLARSAQQSYDEVNKDNLDKWRKAYKGTLGALDRDGKESKRKSRQLRKLIYEMVESKIDNTIPMPKIMPRYKTDLPLVDVTENYLKFEVDRILTKYVNDKSERSTYVDGTSWYKVWWDSMENTHERSGNVKIDVKRADEIIPQPGVTDYKQLEYIFELSSVSSSKLYDLYNRVIKSTDGSNMVDVVSCYYLNDEHIVGLFMWAEHTGQVICNEEDWQIRKLRTCSNCGTINPQGDTCRNCGHDHFKYEDATEEILEDDLVQIYNPYDVGETDDENERDHYVAKTFLTAGTKIPFYRINQLPFVPRPAVSTMDSIYGMSEAALDLEMQDMINKVLTKGVDKTLKSGAVVTKPRKIKIGDTDDTFKVIGVNSAEEATMVQTKQIVADTSQDIVMANLLYESARSSSGVTDSFQGKRDTTATSGKAKQYAVAQSAGRIESLRVMKAAAFAGLYELVLKYLLAFSDEERKFVKTLPDGSKKEECWNKYMFLDKDKYGNIYYRDDLSFSSDPSSTMTQSRTQMWEETTSNFIQGTFGDPADPNTLKLYWNMMEEFQYPLAKTILAGIAGNEQKLPFEIEQAIMQNPELQQLIMQYIQSNQDNRGGARPNSGPVGNGATHAANVEKTNEKNRAAAKQTVLSAQQGGGA